MSNIELRRDYEGKLQLRVAGHPASGAEVTSIVNNGGEMSAIVFIPLKHVTMGEIDNVVPFVRSPS